MPRSRLPYSSKQLLRRQARDLGKITLPPVESADDVVRRMRHEKRMAGFDDAPKHIRDRANESPDPMATILHREEPAVEIPSYLNAGRAGELIAKYGGKVFERARAHVTREDDIEGIAAACERLKGKVR